MVCVSEKISVVIPTYKRSDYLCKAIDSVLAQTYPNFEIIVVDDNGDDSPYRETTKETMQKYAEDPRVRYLPQPENKGGAVARNVGIGAAEGEFITFLDDDDEYLPEKLAVQIAEMKKNGWDASVMDAATYNPKGELLTRKIQKIENGMSRDELMRVHLLYHITNTNSFMFRAESIRKFGGFMDIVACQEYMLIMRALEADLTIGYIPKSLVKNYIYGERLSTGEKKLIAENIMIKEKRKHFHLLTGKEKRYVLCRHYGVLFYVQLKRKKYASALKYLVQSVFSSPKGAYSIFEDYKGKLKN